LGCAFDSAVLGAHKFSILLCGRLCGAMNHRTDRRFAAGSRFQLRRHGIADRLGRVRRCVQSLLDEFSRAISDFNCDLRRSVRHV
jgi:hypothetical protein